MKNVLSVLAVVVGVAIFVGWKFFGASAEIAAKNASGSGWNDSRAELSGKFRTVLDSRFEGLEGAQQISIDMTECMTTRAIEFLNGTDCSYLYNKATTSEAEHLSAQEACFKKVGYEDKEKELLLACTKEKFPNDWKAMRPALRKVMKEALAKSDGSPDDLERWAHCVADKDIEYLNASDCKLIDPKAKTADDALRTVDSCYARPGFKEVMDGFVATCKAPSTPAAGAE